MTGEQVDKLLSGIGSPEPHGRTSVTETHISWVILSGNDVYKIKKPLRLHFLDFSTLEKRKFYCEREIMLNLRLTENIYLDVLPVVSGSGKVFIGGRPGEESDCAIDMHPSGEVSDCAIHGRMQGEVIDYAVHMRRMEDSRRMDKLLKAGQVTFSDIDMLAGKIAAFHKSADVVRDKDPRDIPDKFADLVSEEAYLKAGLVSEEVHLKANLVWGKGYPGSPPSMGDSASISISEAVDISDKFSEKHCKRVKERIAHGYTRDCHGDLHAGNIFLPGTPQPFDCIEFSDDLRQTDVLNEIAFLCMDLEAFGRGDLSRRFLISYLTLFPAVETDEDERLFVYYKSYRANVRAKINSLRSRSAGTAAERAAAFAEAGKYLALMNDYLRQLR